MASAAYRLGPVASPSLQTQLGTRAATLSSSPSNDFLGPGSGPPGRKGMSSWDKLWVDKQRVARPEGLRASRHTLLWWELGLPAQRKAAVVQEDALPEGFAQQQ